MYTCGSPHYPLIECDYAPVFTRKAGTGERQASSSATKTRDKARETRHERQSMTDGTRMTEHEDQGMRYKGSEIRTQKIGFWLPSCCVSYILHT